MRWSSRARCGSLAEMRRRRVLIACFGVVLVALLVSAIVETNPIGRRVILPDGSWVQLQHVSYGKEHTVYLGPFWERIVLGLIPQRFTTTVFAGPKTRAIGIKGWKATIWKYTTQEETLVVICASSDSFFWRAPTKVAIIEDEGTGRMYSSVVRQSAGIPLAPPKGSSDLLEVSAWPRRAKYLKLRIVESSGQAVAEFRLRNLAKAHRFNWSALPLPQTNSNGDLRLVLKELKVQKGWPLWFEGGIRAKFEMLQRNEIAAGWSIEEITFADPTGNVWKPPLMDFLVNRDQPNLEASLNSIFSPQEIPWKLEVHAVQQRNFAPGQCVAFPNLTWTNEVHASAAGVELIARIDAKRGDGSRADLVIKTSSDDDRQRLVLVSAVDEQGRPFQAPAATPLRMRLGKPYPTQFLWILTGPGNWKSISVVVAVPSVKTFEFIANPTVVDRLQRNRNQ